MRPIVTAVAALALVAGGAHAQGNSKGNDGGKGNDKGGHAAGASMKGGNGNADRGGPDKGGSDRDQARGAPMQGGGSKDRGNAPVRADARVERSNPGNDNRGNDNRGNDNRAVVVDRGAPARAVVVDRNRDNGRVVVVDRDRDRDAGVVRVANYRAVPARGFITGCPPGLAKKNPPCVPPGQVRPRVVRYDRPDFWGLRQVDTRYRYRYDDGYLLRLDPGGRSAGYIPLLGGALRVGNPWPTYYQPVALPTYYENYYGIGPYNSYRYADNVIYRVNPETAAITSIAALLTGDNFAVGQPMPLGYDVYNVPYAYRTQYVDTPQALYRYSDGYVYQIDPETRLIAAAIELLAT